MENSECVDDKNGYRCICKDGYQGNPYLAYGCQDVYECSTNNNCSMRCHNTVGNYSCSCPRGYKGDGRKDGSGCTKKDYIIEIALGISIGLLVLVTLTFSLCWITSMKAESLDEEDREWFTRAYYRITKELPSRSREWEELT
ncbi:hypothetical protein L6164_037246 [Bauhinia variegata]|uniref:Uncharacterized protein n=1 Tax=Bauhinia variegata TaxID=167791 RepID=A0ACB9KJG3_BAUVA|nr:hypothetical protein L6164_037246 [Bauhinia variegata]